MEREESSTFTTVPIVEERGPLLYGSPEESATSDVEEEINTDDEAWSNRMGSDHGSLRSLHTDHHKPSDMQHKLYLRRWFMLATLFLLNVSNGTMWLTYAPIPNFTAAFYNISLSTVDTFSISYFVVSLLIGFVSIAVLDIWGLRVSLYLGAGFNLVGSCLRWISTGHHIICSPHFSHSGFLVAMIGQILTACAQPFLLYAPTKLAALWFGPKERAFCTMLASLGNPIGLALAQLLSPNIVTETDRLPVLMIVYTAPAAIGAIVTVFAFWRKKPPTPPASSALKESIPFFKGLWTVLTNASFLILLLIWGCAAGLFNAMVTLLAQILCPFGYTDRQSGLWGSLMIFCGLVGATLAGLLIDFTKKFKEVAVCSLSLALLCLIWFTEVSRLEDQPVNVAFSLCLFGFFALPLIPACMELGVEITYPVREATSSGLLWSVVQVMGIVLVLIGQAVQFDLQPVSRREQSQCGVEPVGNSSNILTCHQENFNGTNPILSHEVPQDLTYALLIYCGVGAVTLVLLVAAFRPRYKRVESEERAKALLKLQQQQGTPSLASTSATSNPETEPMDTLSDQENFKLSSRLAALKQGATSTTL